MKEMNSVEYIASYIIDTSPGVTNKIRQTVDALNAHGYKAEMTLVPWGGVGNALTFIKQTLQTRAQTIIVRNQLLVPLLFPVLLWKRLRGKRVLIDIPTPLVTTAQELKMSGRRRLALLARLGILYAAFPLALLPATRIFQYGVESAYFSFGVRRKSKLITNGINVASIPVLSNRVQWSGNSFVMIAVASLAKWHAFDRVIAGLAEYLNSSHGDCKLEIRFIVVGDGPCRPELERLAEISGVSHCVDFVGFRRGIELSSYFEQAHVAISSIGLYRKGIETASDLKSREYTARGLPFVAAGHDMDFDPPPKFVYKIKNCGSAVDVKALAEWYRNISQQDDLVDEIRRYAEERLDFSSKVRVLVEQ